MIEKYSAEEELLDAGAEADRAEVGPVGDVASAAGRGAAAGGGAGMGDFLARLVAELRCATDDGHRRIMIAHLFDDTRRMLDALEPVAPFDAVIGVPYSSNRPGVAEAWGARFGDRLRLPADLPELEAVVAKEIARALARCEEHGQKLIVQDVGGFAAPILHAYFADRLHLVRGVVEITKQGVWRAAALPLAFPVLHCADSELKRLEAVRCGETVARCLDGVARTLGHSLAGRRATVMGAGWIGSGVARALRRLDMVVELVDTDPLKIVEARLAGFEAAAAPRRLGETELLVGATGRLSVTAAHLDALPDGALVASASSRQIEIDVAHLSAHPAETACAGVVARRLPPRGPGRAPRRVLLVNDGFPANFLPGSGSVADEIVETILGELIVLQAALATGAFRPGVHRIQPEQEALCARLWLEMRDAPLRPAS